MTQQISMQLAEKMIRMEQGNSAFLDHKNITYKQTGYFRNLSGADKEKFENYLNQQKRLPVLFSISMLLPLFLFSLTKINFTGNVIAENLDKTTLSIFGDFFLIMSAGALLLFIYHTISKKMIERTFLKNSYIMDELVAKKHTVRRY